MAWFALENIEEALKDSKELLLPFNLLTWAKLALIIILTGYIAAPSVLYIPFSEADAIDEDLDIGMVIEEEGFENTTISESFQQINSAWTLETLFLIIIGGFTGLIALITYIASVFEFVMYKSLIDRKIRIGNAGDYLWEGLQFSIFRAVSAVAILLTLVLAITTISVLNPSFNASGVLTGLFVSGAAFTVVVAVAILQWIVFNFALINMIENRNNLLKAFSLALTQVRDEFQQVAVYWIVKIVISLGLGLLSASIVAPLALIGLFASIVFGFLLAMINPLLVVPILLAYIMFIMVASVAVAVPVRTYLYYYTVEMYRDVFQ